MKKYIEARAKEVGQYIIDSKATIRETAKIFGVSKSTVHKDIRERLKEINPHMQKEALQVLAENKEERTIRGGNATRMHWLKKNNSLPNGATMDKQRVVLKRELERFCN